MNLPSDICGKDIEFDDVNGKLDEGYLVVCTECISIPVLTLSKERKNTDE